MLVKSHAFLASLLSVVLSTFAFAQPAALRPSVATERTSRALERVRNNPLELHVFLEAMPKGADLHNHLEGAVYAETFIHDAAEDHLCVDKAALLIVPGKENTIQPVCRKGAVPASDALTNQDFYDSLVVAFSMRSFVPSAGVSGHDHFFGAFPRFENIDAAKHLGEWIDEVATRAAAQNEQYLEIMHTPDFAEAARLGRAVGWSGNLAATREALLAKGLRQNVEVDRQEFAAGEAARRRIEHCSEADAAAACAVQVRFLFQALRAFPPEMVFAQALLGFELASADPQVVGINLVQPEDWYLPMTEYHRQMQMFDYLHSVYPKVHITLHAGELAPGLVPPAGLKFHIREAVELGHAERIGHGVDVMYERDPHQLLKEMAARHIMVEINLTSNEVILGIEGKNSPLPIYRAAHVPVALSTDDEGVSRIDLTHEYQRAVEEFPLTYADLKDMVRNSIEYSFLSNDEKVRQKSQLEARFQAFEASTR